MAKSKNDQRILKLKKIVDSKKGDLGKVSQNYVTRCSVTVPILDSLNTHRQAKTFNLRTCNEQQCKEILKYLVQEYEAAEVVNELLEIKEESLIQHHTFEQWVSDIKTRFDFLQHKKAVEELSKIEAKLDLRLSDETSTSLELDGLEDLLKGV